MNTFKRTIKWLCNVKINDSKQVWQAVLIIEDLLLNALKNDKNSIKSDKTIKKDK